MAIAGLCGDRNSHRRRTYLAQGATRKNPGRNAALRRRPTLNGPRATRIFLIATGSSQLIQLPRISTTDEGHAGARHLRNDRPTPLSRHLSLIARDPVTRTKSDPGPFRRPLVSLRFSRHLHGAARFRNVWSRARALERFAGTGAARSCLGITRFAVRHSDCLLFLAAATNPVRSFQSVLRQAAARLYAAVLHRHFVALLLLRSCACLALHARWHKRESSLRFRPGGRGSGLRGAGSHHASVRRLG